VEVEVLSEGRSGILGIGSEQARVRLWPLEDEEEEADDEATTDEAEAGDEPDERPARPALGKTQAIEQAVDVLQTMLDLMGLDTVVEARPPQTAGDGLGMVVAVLDVTGEDLGVLIGRRGDTLAALQYVLNLIMRRRTRSHLVFGVDIEGYRRRREASLCNLAQRMADRVRASGQSVMLEPMPPAERRIVHITLADDPDVLTVSIGEGDARKVAITPRR
jgi:spoIIIJ-associated protein